MRMILFVCCLIISSRAWCEQSTDSTGDYAMDLGQVYGTIQSIKYMNEICSQAFPTIAKSNQAAFQSWRKRYLPFLQEVEKHWTTFAWQETNGEPQKHTEFLRKMATQFDQYKEGLRTQLLADGPEAFVKQCNIYPKYLTTERTNIEYFYAEQTATIRRGFIKK